MGVAFLLKAGGLFFSSLYSMAVCCETVAAFTSGLEAVGIFLKDFSPTTVYSEHKGTVNIFS